MTKSDFSDKHAQRVAKKQRQKQREDKMAYIETKRKRQSERSDERFRMPKGMETE